MPAIDGFRQDAWKRQDPPLRTVFTPSKGLPGVGLPRKAVKDNTSYTLTMPEGTKEDIALGWEDVRELREGTITRRVTDDTHTYAPIRRRIVYHASFDNTQRERDYGTACDKLEG